MHDPVLINCWHPVCKAGDLSETNPVAARVLETDLVVWRHADGISAWADLCVHRGSRLSLGSVCDRKTLRCPYHGWEYAADGRVVRIPAHPDGKIPRKAQATAVYNVAERADMIWANLGDAEVGPPMLPEFDDSAFRVFATGPYPLDAAAPRVVENFLDLSHPPILHAGYLGTPEHAAIGDYELETHAGGFAAKDVRYMQPDPDGTGVAQEVSYDFGILAPLTVYFTKHVAGGHRYLLAFPVCPVSATQSIAYFISAMDYAYDIPQQQIDEFQTTIIMQDKPVVESQRPELLPLDLAEELHLPSDRNTVAYRRYLKDLGMTYGTD